jgi:succinate-acetate transporter protein
MLMFSLTNLLVQHHEVHASAPHTTVVKMAAFSGGVVQLLAGMWELVKGSKFGATGKRLWFGSVATIIS